ncbi:Hint domain-containing protein [uncultured Tateyamaria sp.]|uniref:Hint domain-containing protein n=1 Tax=uncultured Tateyamaria sp. TaxID=455651 RepID=UPI002632DF24|nr:Hint domain-containing protein [uncultured Tateyamaria sp.]
MPVEDLVPGQLVHAIDQGLTPVVWIHSRELSADEVNANTKLRPVFIARGALGHGLPRRELRVSQQHRMLVCGKIAERMFASSQVLVPAKALISIDGIEIGTVSSALTYFHIALPQHSILLANGAPSESFYPGKQALAALSEAARDEFLTLFPELRERNWGAYRPARTLLNHRRAQKLGIRHRKNQRELVSRFH